MWLILMSLVLLISCTASYNNAQDDLGIDEILDNATLDSLMFSLNGVIYTLPIHVSELEANGWVPDDPDNRFGTDTLEPGGFATWSLTDGNQFVGTMFTNISEEVLLVSESCITGIIAHTIHFDAQIIFSGNIMIGSTFEDVIEVYGDPCVVDVFEKSSSLSITYASDQYYLRLNIDTQSNLVVFIVLYHLGYSWLEPTLETSSEPPAIDIDEERAVVIYEISDNLHSFMIGLGGVVYTLPVHFSELEANGWRFCDVSNDYCPTSYILKPRSRALWWTLTDGIGFAEVNFTNLSSDLLPISESYITAVATTRPTVGEQPVFPSNITIGSAYEDVLAAYGEPSERSRDASQEFDRLIYFIDYLHVTIRISTQTNRVIFMGMSNLYT